MKRALLLLALFAAASTAAAAEVLAGHPTATQETAPCVEVQIGQTSAGRLSCLNQLLRESVARSTGTPPAATTPVKGSPIQLGQPTPAALRQRYGQAYGNSLQPQRPPAPRYPTSFAPVH